MSLESSAVLWDGLSWWLLAIGATLAFLGTVAGAHARKLGRELAKEQAATAVREKATNDRAIAEANARAAEAQEQTAQAELLIKQQEVQESWRTIDQGKFLTALKKAPHGLAVDIWYKREDTEAYLFALNIWKALSRASGWTATIQAVPLEVNNQSAHFISKDVPSDVKFGSFQELTIKCSGEPNKYGSVDWRSSDVAAITALQEALTSGQQINGMQRSFATSGTADSSMPAGHCMIVVGQKGAS